MEGQAIALAGPSGAGKSTLMVALVRHGAGFVSDDICVLSPLAGARFGVLPSSARAKLDSASLASLNHAGQDLEPAGGDRGKFHLPVSTLDVLRDPPPLTAIFLLRDGEDDPRIERLQGLEAVAALVEETYFLRYVVALGLAAPCFRHAGAVARQVRVARLVRPRGFNHLPLLVDMIGTEARKV